MQCDGYFDEWYFLALVYLSSNDTVLYRLRSIELRYFHEALVLEKDF